MENCFRYILQLQYTGTAYSGWQIQQNAPSVQEQVNKAVSILLKQSISVTGAGRTDAGVHALFYVAHFDTFYQISDIQQFVYKLNLILPNDIAVQTAFLTNPDFNSRFSAISRTYYYDIHTFKNPFLENKSYFFSYKLNVEAMNNAAKQLFNYTDFTSFSKLHSQTKTNNCTIIQAKWEVSNSRLLFVIEADRFLRNMVRAIVGTMLNVGTEKITVAQFCDVINLKNRSKAGYSVPAHALYLQNIKYPGNIQANFIQTMPDI